MNHKFMWAYLIHLSTHMWQDDTAEPGGTWYAGKPYSENNNVHMETWDAMMQYLAECKYNTVLIDVGDAVKYESHPEISAPDAWDKDFLKKKLDEMRALGLTPIPKLNFSCGHMTWLKEYTRMISTPTYYKVCSELIAEVCELFGYPEYFHIGFDEEVARKQGGREKIIIRGQKLWWHDLFYLASECEKHGARPWMWSDYFWERGNEEIFLKNMTKSILQSNWFYPYFQEWPEDHPKRYGFRIKTYEIFDEMGYDQVPTASTVLNNFNPVQTCAFCKERLNPEHLLGIMTAPWFMTTEDNKLSLMNDAYRLYAGRKKYYPETL